MSAPIPSRLVIQHAGPIPSGYATSATTTTTVAQNATPGLFRVEVMAESPRATRLAPTNLQSAQTVARKWRIHTNGHVPLLHLAGGEACRAQLESYSNRALPEEIQPWDLCRVLPARIGRNTCTCRHFIRGEAGEGMAL